MITQTIHGCLADGTQITDELLPIIQELQQFQHYLIIPNLPNRLEEKRAGLRSLGLPITINTDFFAAVLGGRRDLGHHVVYFQPEMQWYFKDSDRIFKPTTDEKLANLYRGLMMKCAEQMPANVHKLNLFHEFRQDKVAKQVVNRAKSILAADHSFFSPTSPNQRIKGQELHERLIYKLVDTMLEERDGACLTVTQAYQIFCRLSEQHSLGSLKRSVFKEQMKDLIKNRYGMSLRHDVPDSLNKHQQAWKGLRVVEAEVLAA